MKFIALLFWPKCFDCKNHYKRGRDGLYVGNICYKCLEKKLAGVRK